MQQSMALSGKEQSAGVESPGRLISLDAFRGAVMIAMVLVNNPGRWAVVYAPLKESEWNGWTFADCVFPSFLFIVGAAAVFSLLKRVESGEVEGKTVKRILRRTFVLILLGLLLNGYPYYHLYDLRIPGVLQRIALCYLVSSLMVLKTRINTQIYSVIGLFACYGMMLWLIPLPGAQPGSLDPARNLVSYIDGLVLPGHLWYNIRPYDPEGILSTIPAIGTTLSGVLAGYWLRSNRSGRVKTAGMLTVGFILILGGQALSPYVPIIKGVWTSSYAIFMAGISLACLAVSYWLIDTRGCQRAATPLVIFGRNAIAAYLFSELFSKTIRAIDVTRADGRRSTLRRYIFDTVYAPLAPGKCASLLFAMSVVCLTFLVVWIMWRKRWFLKV